VRPGRGGQARPWATSRLASRSRLTKYFGQATFGDSDWLDGEMSLVDYGARSVPDIFLEAPLQTINSRTGQGAWNAARFSNPTYDMLSKQYIAALDLSSQRRIAGKIQTLLLDGTPVIYPYSLVRRHHPCAGAASENPGQADVSGQADALRAATGRAVRCSTKCAGGWLSLVAGMVR